MRSPEVRLVPRQSIDQQVRSEVVGSRELMTYDTEFDTQAYLDFSTLRFLDPSEKERQKEELDVYTRSNLQTMLGERFHVLLSKRIYEIRNGQAYSPDRPDEPLLSMYKRGQEYRKNNGSSSDDQEREQAEIDTFFQIQERFSNPNTPLGAIEMYISQPGKNRLGQKPSEYQHNFYDVFVKRKNIVEYRRYSSALDARETFAKALSLDSWYALAERKRDMDFIPDDVFFLKNPIYLDLTVNPHISPDAIHAFFHRGHEVMREDEFQYILAACQGYIEAYVRIVAENPHDRKMRNLAYNALLNRADEAAQAFKRNQERGGVGIIYDRGWMIEPTQAEIVMMGMKQVREVTTGCGRSGGMSLAELLDRNPIKDVTHSRFSMLNWGVLEFSDALGYTFEDPKPGENCKSCNEHAPLGPCGICQSCDRDIRYQNGQTLPIAA